MGLFDIFDRVRGIHRIDGIPVLLVQDEGLARQLRRPEEANGDPSTSPSCTQCGAALEPRILATDLPEGSTELWDEIPVVVDAWVCLKCGTLIYPRTMPPEQVVSFGRRGAELARDERFRQAEWWFTRICWDWSTWPNGHIDLSQALRGRLSAATDILAKNRLSRRAEAALETAIQLVERKPTESSPQILAFAYIALAELAVQRRAPEVARRAVDACLAIEGLDPTSAERAQEIGSYIDEERYIFADAAEIAEPYMNLSNRPAAPVDTPDARKRLVQAVETLEDHYDAHPTHWQSIFVAAMGRATLGDTQPCLTLWRRAWKDHPEQVNIVREYSLALLRAELNEEARDVNRDATGRFSEDATIWCNRAVTELLCKDLETARTCLHKSRELDPEDPIAQALERRLASLTKDRIPRSLRELQGG